MTDGARKKKEKKKPVRIVPPGGGGGGGGIITDIYQRAETGGCLVSEMDQSYIVWGGSHPGFLRCCLVRIVQTFRRL